MNVLLMYYGTPYDEGELADYYTDIRHGHAPPPALLEELRERYRSIGKSPLNEITFSLARKLEGELNRRLPRFTRGLATAPEPRDPRSDARVYVGAKHNAPFIAGAVRQMAEEGVDRAVAVVAAPHYSLRSIAEYRERVDLALDELGEPFTVRFVEEYYVHPGYVAAVARRVNRALWRIRDPERAVVYFTAHSIPLRSVEADGGVYPRQVEATAKAVARRLGLPRWRVAWQSAGRTDEAWLGPDINDALREDARAGLREAVVAAVGFPADHLEVFYDLDFEARQTAAELGVHLVRAESLNDADDYVAVLADLVERAWFEETP
ncbi:ferrochelatase [Oceanithermus desulfurans]